jgi:hypothetical protein
LVIQVLAQKKDHALLHERFGQGARANAGARDLRKHDAKGVPNLLKGVNIFDDRLDEAVEEPKASAVGGGDRGADRQDFAVARSGVELDEAVGRRRAVVYGGASRSGPLGRARLCCFPGGTMMMLCVPNGIETPPSVWSAPDPAST